MRDLALASVFPAATEAQWRALVDKVLKGADFDRKLVGRSDDGIAIAPLHAKAAADGPRALKRQPGAWSVAQRVDHPDLAAANDLALADLAGGANSLTLVLPAANAARGFGVAAETVDGLDRVLRDVMLDLIHLRLDAGGAGRGAAACLMALAERRGHALAALDLDLGLDPIGTLAAQGLLSAAWAEVAKRCADTGAALAARGFAGRMFLADGRPYHEAGASQAQELAALLATGIEYMRALEVHGASLGAARDTLAFLLVADADQFLTIAKFRALRRLWARVEAACGLEPKPIRLHAETAWRMTTRRDPWVNILRTTVATVAAGLGGADTVGVLPLTAALGLPDAFARRIARNTQMVLLEESNLWRVADPAAGSGAFETLTEALAAKAWDGFQAIEKSGGMVRALVDGSVQARIAAVRAERDKAIAQRKEPITGTSEFPDLNETAVPVLLPAPPSRARPTSGTPVTLPPEGGGAAFGALIAAAAGGATLVDMSAGALAADGLTLQPLPSHRDGERYEALRDASDAHLAKTGARPKVFLANLGPIAAFTARSMFTKNLFEAGGIEAVTNDGFAVADADGAAPEPGGQTDLAALVVAFQASGAGRACLCSSDDIYAREAEAAASALAQAGASHLYLAGRPGDAEAGLRQAGITTFIYAGCDVLAVLAAAYWQEPAA